MPGQGPQLIRGTQQRAGVRCGDMDTDSQQPQDILFKVVRFFSAACQMEECPICLQPLECRRQLPCKHSFHEECIEEWFKETRACPVCRHPCPADSVSIRVGEAVRGESRVAVPAFTCTLCILYGYGHDEPLALLAIATALVLLLSRACTVVLSLLMVLYEFVAHDPDADYPTLGLLFAWVHTAVLLVAWAPSVRGEALPRD